MDHPWEPKYAPTFQLWPLVSHIIGERERANLVVQLARFLCGDLYGAPRNAHVILQCQMCAHVLLRTPRARSLTLLYVIAVVHPWMRSVLQPTYNLHLTMRLPVHVGYQRVRAGCQCVHAGCQFSPTSWCGLGPSVRTVLMLTGDISLLVLSFVSTPSFYCRTLVGSLPLANNGQHSASNVSSGAGTRTQTKAAIAIDHAPRCPHD